MGLDDGTSQHSGRYGSGSPPPYLSSHSPNPLGPGHPYNSYSENIVYTPMIGEFGQIVYCSLAGVLMSCIWLFTGPPGGTLLGSTNHGSSSNRGATSDMSNESSPAHNYPDFPPSPDSWIGGGDTSAATNNNSTSAVHYWLAEDAMGDSTARRGRRKSSLRRRRV